MEERMFWNMHEMLQKGKTVISAAMVKQFSFVPYHLMRSEEYTFQEEVNLDSCESNTSQRVQLKIRK